jgi:hypothetical protein
MAESRTDAILQERLQGWIDEASTLRAEMARQSAECERITQLSRTIQSKEAERRQQWAPLGEDAVREACERFGLEILESAEQKEIENIHARRRDRQIRFQVLWSEICTGITEFAIRDTHVKTALDILERLTSDPILESLDRMLAVLAGLLDAYGAEVDAVPATSKDSDTVAHGATAALMPESPTRKELWGKAKAKGATRKGIGSDAFPHRKHPEDCFRKWLTGAAYPDGSEGDKAVRNALSTFL